MNEPLLEALEKAENKSVRSTMTSKMRGSGKSEMQIALDEFQANFQKLFLSKDNSQECFRNTEDAKDEQYDKFKSVVDEDDAKQVQEKNPVVAIDALNCKKIQTLPEFLDDQRRWKNKNDKKRQFFDLQKKFFAELVEGKGESVSQIDLTNITGGPDNFVDVQMMVVSTEERQVPVFKVIERNIYNQ